MIDDDDIAAGVFIETDALDLSESETKALARRVIARHLTTTDFLSWEDLPHLSERAFMGLQDEVDRSLAEMIGVCADMDRAEGIDSIDLLQQATEEEF